MLKVNLKGTYSLGSGTGAYAHLSGSGNYQLSILGSRCQVRWKVLDECSACLYEQIIRVSGAVSLS